MSQINLVFLTAMLAVIILHCIFLVQIRYSK